MKNIMEKMKNTLLRAGLSEKEWEQIETEHFLSNRQNLLIYSKITFGFLLIMFLVSFFSSDVESNRWVYLGTMFIALVIDAIAKFCGKDHPVLLLVDVYVFISILFIFGIILGTVTRPDEQTVTFIALMLTVPLLFTDRPIRMICCIGVYVIVFIIVAVNIKVEYVLTADIIDACIFGAISAIVSTYMMGVKCQRSLFERQVAVMSETDLLTGIRNRNSYEQNLLTYAKRCQQSLTYIFVDVNGLHELNNTKGHEAGDRMLQFVADTLQKQFGKEHTYRIGGDEFVAFVLDGDQDQIRKKLEKVISAVEENDYHISVGYDTHLYGVIDMKTLVDSAEKRMYEEKHLFYQRKGIERRERR